MEEVTVEPDDVREMVRYIDPVFDVLDVTPADRGFSAVYRVTVEGPKGSRDVFLKASPDGEDWGVQVDARLTSLVGRHTSLPVPPMLGVVDDHPELPSPFYLSDALDGEDVPYEAVGHVEDDTLASIARQLGGYLGELHQVDAVDSFGYVTWNDEVTLDGERPAGSADELLVQDGETSWPTYLSDRVDYQLDRLTGTRFEDMRSTLEPWISARISELEGPFEPVLGRNDHGFHNLLVNRETGDVTGVLDWAYTLAVPPAFDVEFAVYLFGGSFMVGVPGVDDRRDLVRRAFMDGYRAEAPDLARAVEPKTSLYEVLAMLRILNDFEELAPRLPEMAVETVAQSLRASVQETIAGE